MKWIGQWTIETYTNFYSASAKRWHLGQVLLHWRSITKVVVTQVLTTVTLRSLESLTTVTGLRTRHQSALRPLRRVLQMPATWRARGKTSWKRVGMGNGIKAWNLIQLASLGSKQANQQQHEGISTFLKMHLNFHAKNVNFIIGFHCYHSPLGSCRGRPTQPLNC